MILINDSDSKKAYNLSTGIEFTDTNEGLVVRYPGNKEILIENFSLRDLNMVISTVHHGIPASAITKNCRAIN